MPSARINLQDMITGKVFQVDVVDQLAPVSPKHKSVNLIPEQHYGIGGNATIYLRDPVDNRCYKTVNRI